MAKLMRCMYCGLLQDEPAGVKVCARCGGALAFEGQLPPGKVGYLQVQMELDQVAAPANQNVERYLLVTLRTPEQVPPEEAAPAGKARPALNFAAVLDVSGSMQGEKIEQVKEAVHQASHSLHDGDIFSLVTFASETACLCEPAVVGAQTAELVHRLLEQIKAGGMTALDGGLALGLEKAAQRRQDNNLTLLLSDGQANVGETDLEKVGRRAFEARQQGLTTSTLGVGYDYNEVLMVEIATQGGGRFYHVRDANQIPAFLAGELGEAAYLAARAVELRLSLPPGATLIPVSAAYPIQQNGREAVVSVGDLPCGIQLEIGLRLALLAQKAGKQLSVEGELAYQSPAGYALQRPINRVTVRFGKALPVQEGVVIEVAEKVYEQLRVASVLGVSRTQAVRPQEAEQQTQRTLESLRAYAGLLGKERGEAAFAAVAGQLDALQRSPKDSKQAVADAYRTMRAVKDFNK